MTLNCCKGKGFPCCLILSTHRYLKMLMENILFNLFGNKEFWMDLIKLNGTESKLELIQRDCVADYKVLSEKIHCLQKNIEDICKNNLKGKDPSLSMKKLSEMLTKEINNCNNLASKSEEGFEKGAKIIQSTIFYIAVAAIWAFCLIYYIIKA